MPRLLDADALQAALAALGGRTDPDSRSLSEQPDKLFAALSFRLVGAAESVAMKAGGATDGTDDEALVAETLGAAGCDSELDALGLLYWRASFLSQAVEYIDIGGPHGAPDPVLQTIGVTAAALTAMLAAARSLRDPDTGLGVVSAEAAEGWRAAIESLREVVGEEDDRSDPHAGHDHAGHDHAGDSHACDCR